MKPIVYTMILCLALIAAACGKDASSRANQNSGGGSGSDSQTPQQPAAQQPNEPQLATAPAVDQLAEQTQTPRSYPKTPDFLDAPKRQIKDLPNFPKFMLGQFRYGAIPGGEMAFINGTAFGTFEEVVDFYDKETKKNKWEVYFNTRDPGDVVWKMTRGTLDEAVVEVKLDKFTNQVQTGISRVRKSASTQETK